MKKGYAKWFAVAACASASAFVAAPAVAQDGADVVFDLTIENDALGGPGGARLEAELADAQFIFIGEDHGFADAPRLAQALFAAAQPYGMRYHAIEAGPHSVAWLDEMLGDGGVDALAAALEGRALALPFVNLREDAELALAVQRSDGGGLWGIDQEFIGSALIHLPQLAEAAPSEAARARATALFEAEQAALATGNQGAMFLFSADADVFAELRALFAGSADDLTVIAALERSARIYQAFSRGENYASNADRIELIKKYFLNAYRAAPEAAPRVLFKMGMIHAGQGTTFLNTHDVGSLVEGVAAANGLDVLRVAFLPMSGTQLVIQPSPDGFFAVKDYESKELPGFLAATGVDESLIGESGYALIAMAPLRRKLGQDGLNALPPPAKFVILGFDYIVTTRAAEAATPLAR